MTALDTYANGKTVPHVILPSERNTHIQGQGIDDNTHLWYLTLGPDLPAAAISACNRAAYLIRNYGNTQVNEARKQLTEVLTGKVKDEDVPFALRVKLAMFKMQIKAVQKAMGQELTEQIIKEQIDTIINYDSMGLFTNSAADSLKEISEHFSSPIKPIELFAMTVTATLALDNLNIHPSVSDGLRQAFDASANQNPHVSSLAE